MNKSKKDVFVGLLRDLAKQVQALDEKEFDDLLTGTSRIELRITSQGKERVQSKKARISEAYLPQIRSTLENMATREEGTEFLENACRSKEDLIRLAKYIDIPVQKTDNVSQLRERIIEATIGYRLRSAAIQGFRKGGS